MARSSCRSSCRILYVGDWGENAWSRGITSSTGGLQCCAREAETNVVLEMSRPWDYTER